MDAIIRFLLYLVNGSPAPSSVMFPRRGPHAIWYAAPGYPDLIINHLIHLVNHFSTTGALVGPDDWYVSEVEIYKDNRDPRPELLLATIQRSPRLPRQNKEHSSDNDPDEVYSTFSCLNELDDDPEPQIGFLIIERIMYRVETHMGGTSQSHNIEDDENTYCCASYCSKEELLMKRYKVEFLASKKLALDQVYLKLSRGIMGSFKLLGRMELPKPPTLPAENDCKTVFHELLAKIFPRVSSNATSPFHPPTATSSSSSPRFISVPALLCLANTALTECKKSQPKLEYDYYWYCSVIFYSLHQYTQADISLGGDKELTVGPMDSSDIIKMRFKKAKFELGRLGVLDIVAPQTQETINSILRDWEKDRMDMEEKYCHSQFAFIRRHMWMKGKVDELVDAAEAAAAASKKEAEAAKELVEAEDARRRVEEKLKKMRDFAAARGIDLDKLYEDSYGDLDD